MRIQQIALTILTCALVCAGSPGQADETTPLEQIIKARAGGRVTFSATVNFFDTRWYTLFVQDGREAIFVRLQKSHYLNPPQLTAGTLVKVSGDFDSGAFIVEAEELEVLGQSLPPSAITLDMGTLTLGDHWSRRVHMKGVIESLLVEDAVAQLVLNTGERRILLRRRGNIEDDVEVPLKGLIGARIDVEGTLAYLTDEQGRPGTIICHQMETDPFAILALPRKSESSREREFEGHLGLVGPTGFATLETDSGEAISLYAPFKRDLLAGDRVRVLAAPHDGKQIAQLPELAESVDCLGKECDFIVRVIKRQYVAPLPPAQTISNLNHGGSDIENQRITITGKLKAVSSDGQQHQLTVVSGGTRINVELTATLQQVEQLKKDADGQVSITGVARFDGNGITIITRDLGAVRVVPPSRFFSRRFGITATLIFCLLLAVSGCSLWILRRQVGRNQRALHNVAARLNSSYEAVREGILVVDSHGCVVGGNDRFHSTLGVSAEELESVCSSSRDSGHEVGRLISNKFAVPREFLEFWQRASSKPLTQMSEEMRLAGNEDAAVVVYTTPIVSAELQGKSAGRIWTFDDVSEQKRLEKNLLQSQKLEAVGRLAGGVAHDFNNLLMAMTANLEIVKANPNQTVRDAEEYISSVEMSATRAAELIRRLLGFSRKTELKMEVTDPNQVVEATQQLLERTIGVGTSVVVHHGVNDIFVSADAVQLQQVLLNVCLNARDALPGGRGTIEIRTSILNESHVEEKLLCITVSDNGTGMTDETRARIFEPFFTTKGPEHGTGLGLAMSFGIIEQHGGRIECDSAVDIGSTFRILLPTVPNQTPSNSFVINAPLPNDRLHLLVADDDNAVRKSIVTALKQNGFRVTEANDGEEAIEAFASSDSIDVVLFDLSMPKLTGLEALSQIKQTSPQTPGIIMTGYLDTIADASTGLLADEIVEKPVSIDQLTFILRSAHHKAQMSVGSRTA